MQALVRLFEPWRTLYANSTAISTSVASAHLFALLIGGGLAIAADRSTLRALRQGRNPWEREHQLSELCYLHRPVLFGLSVVMLTGLLLAAADIETFAVSPVFWAKMVLVLLLVINGTMLARAERRLVAALKVKEEPPAIMWIRLRKATWASLILWVLTAAAGSLLTAAG
jgi:hypothetical protein